MSEGSNPARASREPLETTSSRRKEMESGEAPEAASSNPTCSGANSDPNRRKREAKVKAEETSTKRMAQERD
eukprot:4584816-Prorocentrum_lima.AAC.1